MDLNLRGQVFLLCASWCTPYFSCYLESAIAGCLLGEMPSSFATPAL